MTNTTKSSALRRESRVCGALRAMLLLSAVAAAFIFSASARAASIGPQQPNYTECQRYVWNTLQTDKPGHSYNGATYNLTDNLQQGYDTSFGVWCQAFRDQLLLTANASNQGGTIYAKVGACLNVNLSNSYSFGSGAISGATYYSPTMSNQGYSGQAGDELKTQGQDWSDTGGCAGNP
jgi:hypothetical protein